MNKIEQLIHHLRLKYHPNIRAEETIARKEGTFTGFPPDLSPELAAALQNSGINQLYSHQKEAYNTIAGGRDTLLVSSTASGKTLSFFLPILNQYLQSSKGFAVMLLYPTKALSRDQENTFGRLMSVLKTGAKIGTYDGDTPREERDVIQKNADFIITNPDMLHSSLLPNHNRRWRSFLSRLRFIVVDEVHTYRGAFGSHVSNVFRRLLRVAAIHGSKPVFVCSSATVGNPEELAGNLFHRDFTVISGDGAPKAERTLYFINPPLEQSGGYAVYRKGPGAVSIPLLRKACELKIRTIAFCRARQEVERLYRAVTDGRPDLKNLIKPYRGGLLPLERRQLEKDLFSGKISAIITTNALELGIDIGDLDLCILSGHPGTLASFWQQAGRVGRKGSRSVIVYIAKNNPIDQYLVHHPEFITQSPIEQAWLSADNPYILLQHLPCAAYEYPLKSSEDYFRQKVYDLALTALKDHKTVVPYHDTFRYALEDYPSKGVNLRGMTDYNIEIYCGTEVIGELDPIGARGTLYKDAIYQHLGTRYMSLELDLEKKLCRVEPVNVDYYTEAVWEGRIELTEIDESKDHNGARLSFGSIHVNKQPKLYKKIRERSYENIGYGPITLPPFEYDTTGFSLYAPQNWIEALHQIDPRYTGAAFYGLSYLFRHIAPSVCMADINDISTDVSLVEIENDRWQSALYLFDSIEGGVGYAEKIYENLEICLKMSLELISECECSAGCPACVPSLPPGVDNEDLETLLTESDAARECTRSLLTVLLENRIILPEINILQTKIDPPVPKTEDDPEIISLNKKMNRAIDSLQKKRERQH